MVKPLLRAEGIISDRNRAKVMVQCDREESFYRFPGGSMEFGETAAEAIERELLEEFDLGVHVGRLAVMNESLVEYDGKQRHDCTIIHWCSMKDEQEVPDILWHKEREGIKLLWKTTEEMCGKPVYPEGILEILQGERTEEIHHLVIRKNY